MSRQSEKVRKEVLKALRGPEAERLERLRALGPAVVDDLLYVALARHPGAQEGDVEAAGAAVVALGPDLDLAPLADQALLSRDYAAGALLMRWGARAVELILARYPGLEAHAQFVSRVMLSEAGVRDDRVLELLLRGLATGDPAGLLARYGDPTAAEAIAAFLRASPVRARLADAELERQMDLIEALERLSGELPADLKGRSTLLQALWNRSLQDELHGQFEGKPRLVHAIEPLARSLTGTSGTVGVDGKPGRG